MRISPWVIRWFFPREAEHSRDDRETAFVMWVSTT
jgi:hypothetical protein